MTVRAVAEMYRYSIDHVKGGESRARFYRTWWRQWPDPDNPRVSWTWSLLLLHPKSPSDAGRLGGHGVGFQFGRNGSESDVGLDIYAGRLGSFWFRIRSPWTGWLRCDGYDARHTGLRFAPHRAAWLSWELDQPDGRWSRTDPWWRRQTINKHTILGRQRTETETLDSGTTSVPMPEGAYPALWTRTRHTSHYVGRLGRLRDRVLGPRQSAPSIMLDIPGGIPVQGKGENSWDCGMDGIFGTSGRSIEDAVGNTVSAALRGRERYGGPFDLTRPTEVREFDR